MRVVYFQTRGSIPIPTPDAPASGALGIANITPGIVTQPGVITGIELRPSVF